MDRWVVGGRGVRPRSSKPFCCKSDEGCKVETTSMLVRSSACPKPLEYRVSPILGLSLTQDTRNTQGL